MIPLYLVAFSISSACFTQMPFYFASILFVTVFPSESLPAPSLPVFFFCSLGEVPIESHSGIKLPSGAVILSVFCRIFFAFVLVLSIWFYKPSWSGFCMLSIGPPWHLTGKEGFVFLFHFPARNISHNKSHSFFSLSCTSTPPRWISLFCNQTSARFAVCNLRGYTELWPSAESSTEADSCQRILKIVRNIGYWLKQTALFQCFIWVCLSVCD